MNRVDTDTFNSIFGKFSRTSKKRIDLAFDYEETEILLFRDLCNLLDANVVIDIGANIGVYSIMALSAPSVNDVYSIEASPNTYRELQKNVNMNRSSAVDIKALNYAVSSERGEMDFIEFGTFAGHNSLESTSFVPMRQDAEKIKVISAPLDEIIDVTSKRIAVKIDVEGHEINVLRGMKKHLAGNVGFLQIEIVVASNIAIAKDVLSGFDYTYIYHLKNDFYFLHDNLKDSAAACHAVMLDHVGRALVDLMDIRRKRRSMLRTLNRANGDALEQVSRALRYGRDPVIRPEK
jgi:FkbM family methyltransferase